MSPMMPMPGRGLSPNRGPLLGEDELTEDDIVNAVSQLGAALQQGQFLRGPAELLQSIQAPPQLSLRAENSAKS